MSVTTPNTDRGTEPETFVETARVEVPKTKAEWNLQRDEWLKQLRTKSFPSLTWAEETTVAFTSNPLVGFNSLRLGSSGAPMFVATRADEKSERVILTAEFLKMGARGEAPKPGVWHGLISFPRLDTNALTNPKRLVSDRSAYTSGTIITIDGGAVNRTNGF